MENLALEKAETETRRRHLERLKEVLRARKRAADDAREVVHHVEAARAAALRTGATAPSRVELERALREACVRLGVAKGQVDIAEAYLVTALNR